MLSHQEYRNRASYLEGELKAKAPLINWHVRKDFALDEMYSDEPFEISGEVTVSIASDSRYRLRRVVWLSQLVSMSEEINTVKYAIAIELGKALAAYKDKWG